MLMLFQDFSKEKSGQTPVSSYWGTLRDQAGHIGLGGLCSIKVQHRQAPAHRVSNSLIPMCMNSSTLLFTLRGKPLNPLRHPSLSQPVRGCCFLCPLIQLAKSSCGSGGRLAQSVVSCST